MNKKEAAWRLRRHTALLAVLLAAMLVLTLAIYFLEQSRPDPDALTVGLEDSVIISISEKRVAQTLAQGAEQDNIKIIKPSLYSVVQPDPQTSKYALFEQMLIAQSCDVVIGTAKTAKELFRLGLILPVENIGFEFEGEYLAGCVELGYVDLQGAGIIFITTKRTAYALTFSAGPTTGRPRWTRLNIWTGVLIRIKRRFMRSGQ